MEHNRMTFEEIEAEAERLAAELMRVLGISREEVSRKVSHSLAVSNRWRDTMPAPPPPWVTRKTVTGWVYKHPSGLNAVASIEAEDQHLVSVTRVDGRWPSQSDVSKVAHAFFPGADPSVLDIWRERGRSGVRMVYLSAECIRVYDEPAA